ncbi:DnaD domain protein [Paraclostridium tenue]
MAVYRHIHIDFWQDGFILDLTPEEKYFYMYLMTNSKTSQCGIYELPKRIIETETGYNRETVEKLLSRFEDYGKVVYSEETKEVFLKNWIKHNKIVSPKVRKCIEKELKNIKSDYLVDLFLKECDRYGYSIDTADLKYDKAMDSVCIPIVEVDLSLGNHYGEKEKEKQKEKQKEKEKQKQKIESKKESIGMYVKNNIDEYAKLYEENIGLINGVVGEWLIEVSEDVDIKLFKRAIEIATDNKRCNKGYVNGIIRQWRENNIKTYEDLKDYEAKKKNKGGSEGGKYEQSKYQRELKKEDSNLYRKPTEEELRELRAFIEEEI